MNWWIFCYVLATVISVAIGAATFNALQTTREDKAAREACYARGGDRFGREDGYWVCSSKPFIRRPKIIFRKKIDE